MDTPFVSRDLKRVFNEVINEYGAFKYGVLSLFFSDLPTEEQERLVGEMIKHGAIEDWEWIYECGKRDVLSDCLVEMLTQGSYHSKVKLISKVNEYVVEHYTETAQSIIEYLIPEVASDFYSEAGLRKIYDPQTGEPSWIRV